MSRWFAPAVLVLALLAGVGPVHAEADGPDLTADIPSATYRAGDPGRPITGHVDGAPGRVVEVQARGANGTWVPLAQTRSSGDGRFSVRTPTWWVARMTLRAYAPAAGDDPAAVSADTGRVRVTRAYRPRGGDQVRYLTTRAARWDPCRPIGYRINPHRMWPGATADVAAALRTVSQATGLRFDYRGRSTFVPYSRSRAPWAFPGNADLVVAWSTPAQVPGLSGSTIGLGGSSVANAYTRQPERIAGGVVLDGTQRLGRTKAQAHRFRMALLLHEIGHAVGLDHVGDRREIMYAQIQDVPAQYAAGDLRGLAALGAGGGCLPDSVR